MLNERALRSARADDNPFLHVVIPDLIDRRWMGDVVRDFPKIDTTFQSESVWT
jgi:hypothetical protein